MAAGEEHVIAELRAGRPVLLPTDTVYGLASRADEAAVERLYAAKGRRPEQPTGLVTSSVEELLALLPEACEHRAVLDALLPGPYTLVLPNPARRYAWLTGAESDALGVRVPTLPAETRRVLDAVGAVAATSANDPGGHDPRTLDDVPARLRDACAALDAGPLPGTPSTVIDLTEAEPRVLREGAVPSAEAIAAVRKARVRSR
jgi:L-threonylcarbamoyladenylate synthase